MRSPIVVICAAALSLRSFQSVRSVAIACKPAIGQLGFAGGGLRLDPYFGERSAISRDLFVDLGKLGFEMRGVGQLGERFLRFAARRHGFVTTCAGPLSWLL